MIGQRYEDRAPTLLLIPSDDEGAQAPLRSLLPLEDGGGNASREIVLVWPAAEGTWAFEGRIRLLENGREVTACAEGLAAEWHRDRLRLRRQAEAGERFVVFSEQVARARTVAEVLESLIEHAAAIVGGYRADVLPESVPAHSGPILFKVHGEDQDAFSNVVSLCAATGAQAASLASIGEGMTLVVLERRSSQTYDPQHWYLLRALATQATAGLQRLAITGNVEGDASPMRVNVEGA